MNWQEMFESIADGSAKGVYLFHGAEEFVKRSALDKLREKVLPQGLEALNEAVMETAGAQAIIENAETLPVMSDKRLVVVKDWPPLVNAKAKEAEDEVSRLEKWLPNAPDTSVVVFFVRGEADKRMKAYKILEKSAHVVLFPLLTDAEIVKWVQARVKQQGKTIRSGVVSVLVFLAGRELTKLQGEVEKLIAYVEDKKEITEEDVRKVVSPGIESNVFMMIDRLMEKKATEAYEILNAMLDAGESCFGILAMITRQLRLLTHMRLLCDQNLPLPEIERRMGISKYVASHAYAQSARLSASVLEEGYRASVEFDYAVKSGKVRERAALDAMIFKLYSISQKINR